MNHVEEGLKGERNTNALWDSVQKYYRDVTALEGLAPLLESRGWKSYTHGTWTRGKEELTVYPMGEKVRVVLKGGFNHVLKRADVVVTLAALFP